jgi:uncharacterized protein (DUF169 family)
MNLVQIQQAGEELYHKLHFPTCPVEITYIKKEDIPEQAAAPHQFHPGTKISGRGE